jgi:hypothetical protein
MQALGRAPARGVPFLMAPHAFQIAVIERHGTRGEEGMRSQTTLELPV